MNLKVKEVPLFTAGGAVYPYSKGLEDKFTFVDRFGSKYALCRKVGNLIYLPREICPLGQDKRVKGIPVKFHSGFVPRNEDQERLVSESTALLKKGTNHILEAPTGAGKTVMGVEIAGRVGVKFMIVVPKEDIIKQWHKSLVDILKIPPSKIGIIQGDKCQVAGKDVVIAMVHSVCKEGRYPTWVYQEFGLIIWDEVHIMGADTFSESAWMFPGTLRLGLSATPYRKDGREKVFQSHIGRVMVQGQVETLIPKILVMDSGWKVPIVTRKVFTEGKGWRVKQVPLPHSPGRTQEVNKAMAANAVRNWKISGFVKSAYDKGRNIVIMSELKEGHLEILHTCLMQAGIPQKDIAYYVGGMKEAEREKAKATRVVLATYQMTAMATDAPWWDTLVLATPRSDVVQIVGRVRREYEGKICLKQEGLTPGTVPVVLDIVDRDSPLLSGYAESRMRWYKSIGARIVQVSS